MSEASHADQAAPIRTRSCIVAALLTLFAAGCAKPAPVAAPAPAPAAPPLFEEVTEERGLTAIHRAGDYSRFPMPQIMGSGGALFDANGDGRLDVLVVPGDPSLPDGDRPAGLCGLYLQDESGLLRDASEAAGLRITNFGMGVAAADLDNDGDQDLLLTADGSVRLYLNDGAARFTDVTEAAGLADPKWSTAAALFDFDRDGWLDILIVNYVDYLPGSRCEDRSGRRDYCGPQPFAGTVDLLYRNLGGSGQPATFEDVTLSSGLTAGPGKGLGAICSDFTGDGLVDLLVANDQEPNRLWVQQSTGTFVDEAALRGCAVDLQGRPQANMGTVWFDADADGDFDAFITHLRGETNTLFTQLSEGVFVDGTADSGLGGPSLDFTGFGVVAIDLELDGDEDLVIANGRVMRSPLLTLPPGASHWDEYAERNQIFLHEEEGRFVECRSPHEPFLQPVEISRGLAMGDLDNDGAPDLLVTSVAAPARLYRNVAPRNGHWLTIRATDPELRRDAIGARVIVRAAGREFVRELQPHTSYLSSHDPRIHFGLGPAASYDEIEVVWPHGSPIPERFEGGEADRFVEIRRGEGITKTAEGTP